MSRDGSSGGCIRLVNITKEKEEREFIPYNDLPNKMWLNDLPNKMWYNLNLFLLQLLINS